jgi:hypothetical protein
MTPIRWNSIWMRISSQVAVILRKRHRCFKRPRGRMIAVSDRGKLEFAAEKRCLVCGKIFYPPYPSIFQWPPTPPWCIDRPYTLPGDQFAGWPASKMLPLGTTSGLEPCQIDFLQPIKYRKIWVTLSMEPQFTFEVKTHSELLRTRVFLSRIEKVTPTFV